MIGTSAIVVAIGSILTLVPTATALLRVRDGVLSEDPLEQSGPAAETLVSLGANLFQALWMIVLTGLLTVAVSDAVIGRRIRFPALWARSRPRLLPLIGLTLLQGLAMVGAVAVAIVPGVAMLVAGESGAGIAGLVLGVPIAIVVSLFLATRWQLAPCALLLEGQRVTAAMRRSWQLTRGSAWRVFGIVLLTRMVVGIMSGVFMVFFSTVSVLVVTSAQDSSDLWHVLAALAVQSIGTVIAGAILKPFDASVQVLLYVDLRIRREALDVELMRAAESDPAA